MSRSAAAWLAAGLFPLGLVALWHASPVLLWHLRFESQLSAEGDARRLRSDRWSALPAPSPVWAELESGAIALRAPLAGEALLACGRCAKECRLPLDNRGTLGIFDDPSPGSYPDALDHFAPDARDLSLLRSVERNWRTIDALTDRIRNGAQVLESFRFESEGSRGVVTAFRVDGVRRYVIYAYAPDGTAARVIGVVGLERERFEGVLGGLRVEPEHAARASRCTPDSRL